jgi:hypothetical protein
VPGEADPAWDALVACSPTDVRDLQVKLTYVGIQKKATPTIVVSTFYHLVDMAAFARHLPNDEIALLHFTTTPERMREFVAQLASQRQRFLDRGADSDVVLSCELVLRTSRIGAIALELLLDVSRAALVHRMAADAFVPGNDVAAQALDLQARVLRSLEA